MDPLHGIRDIVPCSLCNFSMAPMHCEICLLRLQCWDCAVNRIRELSNDHEEESVRYRRYSSCDKHDDFIIGSLVPGDLFEFKMSHDLAKLNIKRDLRELEKSIFPIYQNLAASVLVQKADLNNNYKKLTTPNKHGENLYRERHIIINKMKSALDEIYSNCLSNLDKRKAEIEQNITDITLSIAYLKKLLESDDVRLAKIYKSRNSDFRKKLNSKVKIILPEFTTEELGRDQIYQQFTSLLGLSFTIDDTSGAEASSKDRPLIDEPLTITSFKIDEYNRMNLLYIACMGDEKIWISDDKMMKLYTIHGKLLKSVQTKSGYKPSGIAVTKNEELVYADEADRTVNIVKKNTQIQTVIKLEGWRPLNVCSTSSGDLLVVMQSYRKQSKVVRFTGTTGLQSIEYNDYASYCDDFKSFNILFTDSNFTSENRNLDICVSHREAGSVVVFNKAGKLRFTYTGAPSTTNKSFIPLGITTDSQGRILVADLDNHRIHVLDQDGQFLCFIDNYNLFYPQGLCVDTRDNLIVAESRPRRVKKIQYCT